MFTKRNNNKVAYSLANIANLLVHKYPDLTQQLKVEFKLI
jgi:hypothetical protein